MTYGSLKPYVTAWIHEAVECLRTPEMQVAIANSFANDGFFSLMRSPLQRQIALEKISNMESLPVLIPTEVEIEGNTFSDLIADDKDLEIEILNEKMNCHSIAIDTNSDSNEEEDSSDDEEILGRGHRKIVPNSKFAKYV